MTAGRQEEEMAVLYYALLAIGTAISLYGFRIHFRGRNSLSFRITAIGTIVGLAGMAMIVALLLWFHPAAP